VQGCDRTAVEDCMIHWLRFQIKGEAIPKRMRPSENNDAAAAKCVPGKPRAKGRQEARVCLPSLPFPLRKEEMKR
jgi:hypothetical protein